MRPTGYGAAEGRCKSLSHWADRHFGGRGARPMAVENRATGWSTLSIFWSSSPRSPLPNGNDESRAQAQARVARRRGASRPFTHTGSSPNPIAALASAALPAWRNRCSSQGCVGLLPSRGRAGVVPLQLLDGPGAVALGDALQDALVLVDGGRCGAGQFEIGTPHGARNEVKRLGDTRQDRVFGGGDEGQMEGLVIVGQIGAAALACTTLVNRSAHGLEVGSGAAPGRQANGLHL